jgi:hypothetical protein
MSSQKDITGEKFGRLTAIKFSHKNKNKLYWLFKCDCGNEKIVEKSKAISGHTKSCGCYSREKTSVVNSTHSMSKTRFYRIYRGIINRCYLSNWHCYEKYGANGITVCDRWLESFENFRDDMYESYLKHVEKFGEKNTSIDRINSDGNYEPDNCRWETLERQANNIKTNVFLEYNGQKKTIRDWEKHYNINSGTLWARLKNGWSIEKSLTKIIGE